MAKIKAIIFDLDDTLISERKYIESGYRHVSNLLADKVNRDSNKIYQLLANLFNISPKNVFNRLFDETGTCYTKETISKLVHQYREHRPDISFFDDVIPCVNKLMAEGIKIGIITDGFAVSQNQKLKAVDAFHYFEKIIITDEIGPNKEYWKPHPQAFKLMAEELEVAFNEMIYVGDNPEKDFYISSIYPIRTIRVHRKGVHADKEYLDNIRETYLIHSLNELDSIISSS